MAKSSISQCKWIFLEYETFDSSVSFDTDDVFELYCSVVGGALIVAGLYIVIWGRQESEKFTSLSHRRLPITHSSREASLSLSDPLLKVLNHRVPPSIPAGTTLPISRSWQQFASE